MKLSEIKGILPRLDNVAFRFTDGKFVPEHFHVTEIGSVDKHFIDCGGTVRHEQAVNFQLWDANDIDHRLKPGKLLGIIKLSEEKLCIGDHEIEVEYQGNTIGKYGLDFDGSAFVLVNKQTACLANDACGAPKMKKDIREIAATSRCTPDSGCC
ncbi:DUF6428 family protein [Flavobacterium sp.]|uniref:DUF6428 family protein n=1 Tax=Flavobacterium sp. TaxID=239 RepID=UPI0040340FBA